VVLRGTQGIPYARADVLLLPDAEQIAAAARSLPGKPARPWTGASSVRGIRGIRWIGAPIGPVGAPIGPAAKDIVQQSRSETGAASGAGLSTGSEIYDSTGNGQDDAFFEGTTNYLLAKVILASNVKCEGKNPVEVAKIQLNGQDRFDEREGRYFDKVQPWQHHTRTPSTGVNVYSFALKPEEHQPSGTCNFSRIDKATLNLTLSVNTVRSQRTAKVRIYAVNYNVLRVMSGMGGLAYSN